MVGDNDESVEQKNQNITYKTTRRSQVYIYLHNSSNKPIHINKNARIGILYEVQVIIEPSQNENFHQIMTTCETNSKFNIQAQDNLQQYICKYILASEEILQK